VGRTCVVPGNKIGAPGAAKVAEALTSNCTLKHLNLEGEEGWWDIGRECRDAIRCGRGHRACEGVVT